MWQQRFMWHSDKLLGKLSAIGMLAYAYWHIGHIGIRIFAALLLQALSTVATIAVVFACAVEQRHSNHAEQRHDAH
jgi:hypothetical protein